MDTLTHWHLMKHDDGSVFGPVTFAEIKEWAKAAQVSPLDKISKDELNWTKAPMYPELEMDWLLQMSDDHYYGPTTLSAIQEFIKEGEIDHETQVINCKDGAETKVGELPFRNEKADELEDASAEKKLQDAMESSLLRLKTLEAAFEAQEKRLASVEATLKEFLTPG